MMKILHVLAQLPDRTGSGIYFKNVIQGFQAKGLDQALIFGQQPPFEFDFSPHQVFPVNFLSEELPFPIAGMSDVMPYDHTIYSQMTPEQVAQWQDGFRRQLFQAKQEFQPDVIIAHHLWYLTSLVLSIFPDTPVVGISHSTDIRQAQRHPQLKEKYCQNMDQLSLVFSLTHHNKEDILTTYQIPEHKIHVMGNGYNPTIFYPPSENVQPRISSDNTIRILYAGKIAQFKGVFELAQTYPILKDKYPNIEFHFIGNGETSKYDLLKTLAQADHLGGFHHQLTLPQKELADLMRAYDIFVLPSYYEGLATIVLEALACKMRVVVSDLAPLRQLLQGPINQSGMIEYVPLPRIYDQDKPYPEDLPQYIDHLTQKLSKQIEACLSEEDIHQEVYEAIQSFAWPQIINRQFQLIQQIIAST